MSTIASNCIIIIMFTVNENVHVQPDLVAAAALPPPTTAGNLKQRAIFVITY